MKKIRLVLIAILLCFVFSSCGKTPTNETVGTTEEKTTVSATASEMSVEVSGTEQNDSQTAEQTESETKTDSTKMSITSNRAPSASATATAPTSAKTTQSAIVPTTSAPLSVTEKPKKTISVTLSVDCSNAVNKGSELAARIAPDGVIMRPSDFEVDADSTVFDLTKNSGLVIGSNSSVYGEYIYSINSLAERDCGSVSGWIYRVNGVVAQKACSAYVLSDGDKVEWIYTTNGGRDIA